MTIGHFSMKLSFSLDSKKKIKASHTQRHIHIFFLIVLVSLYIVSSPSLINQNLYWRSCSSQPKSTKTYSLGQKTLLFLFSSLHVKCRKNITVYTVLSFSHGMQLNDFLKQLNIYLIQNMFYRPFAIKILFCYNITCNIYLFTKSKSCTKRSFLAVWMVNNLYKCQHGIGVLYFLCHIEI